MCAWSLRLCSHDSFTWSLDILNDSCHCTSHFSACQVWTSGGNATASIDLISRAVLMISFTCVTFTDSRWETGIWPIFLQMYCSHDLPSIYKWQVWERGPIFSIRFIWLMFLIIMTQLIIDSHLARWYRPLWSAGNKPVGKIGKDSRAAIRTIYRTLFRRLFNGAFRCE